MIRFFYEHKLKELIEDNIYFLFNRFWYKSNSFIQLFGEVIYNALYITIKEFGLV